jgi:predicted ATPase
MTKENLFVITGGPGAGKTTLLNALKANGYSCVDEMARTLIKEGLQRGLTPRPKQKEFAGLLFEKDLDNYNNCAADNKIYFFDRSFLDSAAMLDDSASNKSGQVISIVNSLRFNNKVFIAPPWEEIFQNDNERDQTYQESIAVYERLYKWYKRNNYDLIILPKVSVLERVEFIITHLNSRKSIN